MNNENLVNNINNSDDNMVSENVKNKEDIDRKIKIEKMTDYRVGKKIYGNIIEKIYFTNDEKKFIILKTKNDGQVKVYGQTPNEIVDLLAECSFLTQNYVKSKKNKEMFEYQRAIAINSYLIGEKQRSKEILNELLDKLHQKVILNKKISYIGIYLIITLVMIGISIWGGCIPFVEKYIKYIKISTFGSFGGYIALNVKLKDVKFEVSESTVSYIIVSIYKLVFAMISSIISYFFIESDIILSVLKNNSSDNIYLIYTIATLAGFSESFLPNIFKNIEKDKIK
ncbi:hypothetical protein [Clostridium botulinum]|uniref:hypothetical protein n=1 Tax=Clostridium botulinum TaxID=1491 RepID=UPI000774DEAD|nr:hypothetical protein [Clostridium botulinum]MBY6929901.1 hypothetical protein [Clostridium botulinum]NFG19095.1 hypothetical protein [Clostridium botulinum]NFO80945.1 hypothetical protein [Clostridium botulinum]